ncbi:hypothetical protein RM780_24525 [Streptomyces sp. DSM 44917]|uniref:Uncharacterized protein n=1 Tax=Streptomyces boetiae TaxID=3075541 RepID=A0ABU2LF66_9ACTN|nr:hypothetical protein [Streptomyces sp. DSM 44917]MDT0310095.1 hypothetical protein [Streptomyces sp. DSM 44917]
MAARAQTPGTLPGPAPGDGAAARPAPEIRLSWWALAMPAVAFAALLMLLLTAGGADAAPGAAGAERQPAGQLMEQLRHVLLP